MCSFIFIVLLMALFYTSQCQVNDFYRQAYRLATSSYPAKNTSTFLLPECNTDLNPRPPSYCYVGRSYDGNDIGDSQSDNYREGTLQSDPEFRLMKMLKMALRNKNVEETEDYNGMEEYNTKNYINRQLEPSTLPNTEYPKNRSPLKPRSFKPDFNEDDEKLMWDILLEMTVNMGTCEDEDLIEYEDIVKSISTGRQRTDPFSGGMQNLIPFCLVEPDS
ncbi:uncharacterized protein [Halyomorpha halys]|uniref:uncharacterized protein n=1 Tax=Halyomorpha halys TaxID=286706 RepID=UPI0006D4F6B7|nr:uncharacterized protein LOC106680661 [Halyomorpha halys]